MRKLLALAVALALVLSMSAAVFATDSSSTDISYTKEAAEDPGTGGDDPGTGGEDPGTGGEDPGTGGEDPQQPTNTYTLSIPRSITLDADCTGRLTISAESLDLADDKCVAVRLNTQNFDEHDGGLRFFLYKDKGTANESRVPLLFSTEDNFLITGTNAQAAAKFSTGDTDAKVVKIRCPYAEDLEAAAAGDYSGTLHFNIAIEDK